MLQPAMAEQEAHRIDTEILIPGRGVPLNNMTIVLRSGKIVYIGSLSVAPLPPQYRSLRATRVPVLMPGLWDCHVHYYGAQQASIDAFYHVPAALAGARGAHDVAATLRAGFTSVRELGGYGIELARAIEEGSILGPRIYSAISPISMTAGHGDAHNTPLPALQDAIQHGLPLQLCDGIDECLKAVRLQIRRGASLIKVCASGGVVSQLDNPQHQQFSDGELRAMVEEAARADLLVAAHCHGKKGIMAALRAGCKTIEHGSYLDDEAISLMLEKDAMLIATRTFIEDGLKMRDSYSPESYAKLEALASSHAKAYKMAVKAGVKIALGTDLGFGGVNPKQVSRVFGHGRNGQELHFATDAGMTALEAIEAATANAPQTLGLQAPLSGQLKVGYDADLIALRENPLNDIGLFSNAENISHVWCGGVLLKAPEQ